VNTPSYDEGELSAAIRRCEERLAKDPTSLVFATLADLYRKSGRVAEVVALCRKGLERFPHYTTARLILAKAYLDTGDHEAAVNELTAILDLSPKDVQCLRLLADAERRRGNVDVAVRHLEAAVRLDPGDRESRAALRLLRPAPAGVETGVGRALRDDVFVTVTFGTICLEQGLVEEAADVFTRLLRRRPDNPRAREGLEQALQAKSGRKRG
jgi:tetratricopeptide (TPR) repeat protein